MPHKLCTGITHTSSGRCLWCTVVKRVLARGRRCVDVVSVHGMPRCATIPHVEGKDFGDIERCSFVDHRRLVPCTLVTFYAGQNYVYVYIYRS